MRRTTLTAPKVWILGSAVLSLLLIVVVGLTYRTVPPGIGPPTCLLPAPPDERPNDRFAGRGGHSTRDPNIRWQNGAYTIDDVAQGSQPGALRQAFFKRRRAEGGRGK